jgi:16S rRNA processing protein RimM
MPGEKRTWPQEPREGYTAVGRVLRPHGLGGELRIESFSASGVNLQAGRSVFLDGTRRRVQRARADRDAWIVHLQGLRDRTEAEGYRGALLEVLDGDVQRESEDSFFIHELIGLRVVTTEGRDLGELVEVLQPGANDVYVVRGEGGELLIPVIAEVIEHIDVMGGVVVITPLPGMLDESK